ncbi:uncharacterized protein KY384_000927 [Bacidia gigantensis]|uniref:uncharacterized protein n=1 Tax=Bacidia gigantensis TaxID=2732470 RepID=UPI001D0406C8|nr:uncharacterized protein KY384_000927 [Bacidia gigantensis]KAG8534084.1 hypothetical protein KY384_000927 [Bacidia gigantensis]
MSNLTSRIRPLNNNLTSIEDIFSDGLDTLFPDSLSNLHGDPGSSVVYASSSFGNIQLELAKSDEKADRLLFAHYLWNASLLLAELLGQAKGDDVKEDRPWDVRGERVLELGAGV